MARWGSTTTVRAQAMRRVLTDWERSGLTLAEFGRRRDISYASLTWWRQVFRHAERAENQAPKFTEIKVVPSTTPGPTVEVVLRSGHVVRVPAGVDPATLRTVLAVLEPNAPC